MCAAFCQEAEYYGTEYGEEVNSKLCPVLCAVIDDNTADETLVGISRSVFDACYGRDLAMHCFLACLAI